MKKLSHKSRPTRGKANLTRLRRFTDTNTDRAAPVELVDLPEGFWDEAPVIVPVPKRAISLRVDEDVLSWFRASGPRYQSRMNAVLRTYMAHVLRRKRGRGAGLQAAATGGGCASLRVKDMRSSTGATPAAER